MIFRVLKDEQSLAAYSILTEKHISVRFPVEYLQKSRVVALFNEAGEICGGYVLVLKGPFRVIQSLPESVRDHSPDLQRIAPKQLFELTGLWLSPKVTSKPVVLSFWLRLYFDILSTRKSHFVYAYSLNKKSLSRIYGVVNPRVIFRGLTQMQPGMKQPESESVEIASVVRLALIPMLKPHFLAKKLVVRRSLASNLDYQKILNAYDSPY